MSSHTRARARAQVHLFIGSRNQFQVPVTSFVVGVALAVVRHSRERSITLGVARPFDSIGANANANADADEPSQTTTINSIVARRACRNQRPARNGRSRMRTARNGR